MALLIDGKKKQVELLHEYARDAISAVVVDTRGVRVTDITRVRADARSANLRVRVVRNTLARRAVVGTSLECLTEVLSGPSMLVLSRDEPGAPAKLSRKVSGEIENFKVRALVVGGQLYGAEHLDAIANLPSREVALAQLLGTLQAPLGKLLGTLLAVPEKWVRTLAAIKDDKDSGSVE
ncbi:MAG: 50S ribosomal protein L10 [Gammaproteobacteria bacterium AqS3]|nr:50S ribosomal protein L10 [Gammaproteobacteria bacterium AqS3]